MTDIEYGQAVKEQAKVAAFDDALQVLITPVPETISLSDLALITAQVNSALVPLADVPNEDGTIPGKLDVEILSKDFYVALRDKIEQLKNAAIQVFAAL